jgi:hypothetical protein
MYSFEPSCLDDTTWLVSPPPPSLPQALYCADHSQCSQGLIKGLPFPALWNGCLQLYNVVGICAVKRCLYFIKKLCFLCVWGNCFLLLVFVSYCNQTRVVHCAWIPMYVTVVSVAINHEYPAYCSLNTHHPLAWLLSRCLWKYRNSRLRLII